MGGVKRSGALMGGRMHMALQPELSNHETVTCTKY